MAVKAGEAIPQFEIPLTDDELRELGRFCAIWGQIDHLLFACVSKLVAVDLKAGITFLDNLTTGPLVNLLRKNRHRITDPKVRETAKTFCEDMNRLIKTRNHIIHGIWGWHIPGKSLSKATPGCMFLQNQENPIYPSKITEAANKAAALTFVINRVYCELYSEPPQESARSIKFAFGKHRPRVPEGTQITQYE